VKLFELRYNKGPIVDKIMIILDDVAVGGNLTAIPIFDKYGIDPYDDPESVRRQLSIMDEFKVMQLYRALVGGK